MSELKGSLGIDDVVVNEMGANFEEQRRHIGRAHQFRNKICHLSKTGINELGKGNQIEAEIHLTECEITFDELIKLNLPEDKAWEFIGDAAQEMVELMAIIKFYPFLASDQSKPIGVQMPNNKKMGVSETAWLAGIADAAGEINKLMVDIEYHQVVSQSKTLGMYERGLMAIQEMAKILDKFALVYPLVVSNTRRRGQGFSSKLRYVRMAELRAKENVIRLRRMNHD